MSSSRPQVARTLELLKYFDKDRGFPTRCGHPKFVEHQLDNLREESTARVLAKLTRQEVAGFSPLPSRSFSSRSRPAVQPSLKSCLKQRAPERPRYLRPRAAGTEKSATKSVAFNPTCYTRKIRPFTTESHMEHAEPTFSDVPRARGPINVRSFLSVQSDNAAEFRSFLAERRARRTARTGNRTPANHISYSRQERPRLPASPTKPRDPLPDRPKVQPSTVATLARAREISRRIHHLRDNQSADRFLSLSSSRQA